MLTAEELLRQVDGLRQARLRDTRAPHKPLLLLYLLGRLGRDPVGLEAAHVRWWAFAGPDEVRNALALCELHHKLFDRGALGLGPDHTIRVSPAFSAGSEAARRLIGGLEGQPVRSPHRPEHSLAREFLTWHGEQVFRAQVL